MHMVQNIKVITIKGPPGIGKTEVGWLPGDVLSSIE